MNSVSGDATTELNHPKRRFKGAALICLGIVFSLLATVLVLGAIVWLKSRLYISTPQVDELSRYPDMEVFLPQRNSFRGIRHNLDTGEYVFAFTTSHESPDEYFQDADNNAVVAGWVLDSSSTLRREYSRPNRAYPAAIGRERVSLKYDQESSEVLFTWQ